MWLRGVVLPAIGPLIMLGGILLIALGVASGDWGTMGTLLVGGVAQVAVGVGVHMVYVHFRERGSLALMGWVPKGRRW